MTTAVGFVCISVFCDVSISFNPAGLFMACNFSTEATGVAITGADVCSFWTRGRIVVVSSIIAGVVLIAVVGFLVVVVVTVGMNLAVATPAVVDTLFTMEGFVVVLADVDGGRVEVDGVLTKKLLVDAATVGIAVLKRRKSVIISG